MDKLLIKIAAKKILLELTEEEIDNIKKNIHRLMKKFKN
jgi:hypothetical protein